MLICTLEDSNDSVWGLSTIWIYTSVGQALGTGDGFYHLCADDCGGEEGNFSLYWCYGLGYMLYK